MGDYLLVETHNEFAKRQDEENKRQNERIKILEESVKQVQDLTFSVKDLAESMKDMLEVQKEHGIKLTNLENRSVEKWRKLGGTIAKTAITAIVTGVVCFLLGRFGIS